MRNEILYGKIKEKYKNNNNEKLNESPCFHCLLLAKNFFGFELFFGSFLPFHSPTKEKEQFSNSDEKERNFIEYQLNICPPPSAKASLK